MNIIQRYNLQTQKKNKYNKYISANNNILDNYIQVIVERRKKYNLDQKQEQMEKVIIQEIQQTIQNIIE